MATALSIASMLRLHGADAVAFAHAQFTSDVRALEPGRCGWSAWLDAQGRARAVFALLRIDTDELVLWQPMGDAATLRADLGRYVLRSKLRIDTLDGWQVERPAPSAPPPDPTRWLIRTGGYTLRLPGTEPRAVALVPASGEVDAAALADWRRCDIADRLPWIDAATSGRFVPQALELERLDAIRFDKGCYPGQEVAARLHFRGGNKRGLRTVATGPLTPQPGAPLFDAGGSVVGHILYGVAADGDREGEALAVVQLDATSASPAAGLPDGSRQRPTEPLVQLSH